MALHNFRIADKIQEMVAVTERKIKRTSENTL
jgi:hypothetical protein